MAVDVVFTKWDRDRSGSLSVRELFKLLQHYEAENKARIARERAAARKVRKEEKFADLDDLRAAILQGIGKASAGWSNDVPKTFQAEMNRGRANPTIGARRLF